MPLPVIGVLIGRMERPQKIEELREDGVRGMLVYHGNFRYSHARESTIVVRSSPVDCS
jgi:hypothetical protein